MLSLGSGIASWSIASISILAKYFLSIDAQRFASSIFVAPIIPIDCAYLNASAMTTVHSVDGSNGGFTFGGTGVGVTVDDTTVGVGVNLGGVGFTV